MREIRMSGSMRGCRKRAVPLRACALLYRGQGAVRDPLPVQLAAGENDFVFLCDNMGRLSEGKCLDLKGIRGPAYLAASVRPLGEPRWSVPAKAASESWEYRTYRAFASADMKLTRASFHIAPRPGEGLQLSLRSVPQYAWIALDGQLIGEHAGDLSLAGGIDFSSYVLDARLKPVSMLLEITLFGEPAKDLEDHLRLLAYPLNRALEKWAFRPWNNPVDSGAAVEGHPAWWESSFAKPDVPGPFFLVTQGLSKGQIWLNGKALGRYWEIGPQHSLYVPDPLATAPESLGDSGRRREKSVADLSDARCARARGVPVALSRVDSFART